MGDRLAHMLFDRLHAQPGHCRYFAITIAVEPVREKYLAGPGFETGHDRLEADEGISRFQGSHSIEALEFIDRIIMEFGAAPNGLARLVPDEVERRLPQVCSRSGDIERIVPSPSGKPHEKLLDDIGGPVRRNMPSRIMHEPVAVRMVETLEPVGIAPDKPVLRRQGLALADHVRFRAIVRCPPQPHDDALSATTAAEPFRKVRKLSSPIFMGFLHTEFARPGPNEANVLKSSTGAFSRDGLDIRASGPDAFAPSDCSRRGLAHLHAGKQRYRQLTHRSPHCKLSECGTRT